MTDGYWDVARAWRVWGNANILPRVMESKMFHYHVVDLPDGSATPGKVDLRDQPGYVGLERNDFVRGKRFLDIGANDGFWAFWAERNGAADVLATDVETYDKYDWGFAGVPEKIKSVNQQDKAEAFWHLHRLMKSKVRREACSVYELDPAKHGQFDIVINYGLLYHLRHPLLSLDRVRRVCSGVMVMETHVCPAYSLLPMSLFYEDDVYAWETNWTGPSEACVVHWMKSAGFWPIFAEKRARQKIGDRQRFIGIADAKYAEQFAGNENFIRCGEEYFRQSREQLEKLIASWR